MNITIIGAGNAGSTMAADLTLKGHRVTLLKTSNKLHNEHYDLIKKTKIIKLKEGEKTRSTAIHCITTDFKEAIKPEIDLFVVYIQTNYHEELIKRMETFLSDGQMILFEPGYLSTAYLLKHSSKDLISIEAESSPLDCRISSPGTCTVFFRNEKNPVGVYPKNQTEKVLEKLTPMGYNFTELDSVIEAAMHNPNLIVHTIGAIMSMPRIEYSKGEYWMYKEVFTPIVWNIVDGLDGEKIKVLEKLNIKGMKYVDVCKDRNFPNCQVDAKEAFFDYANNHSVKGPNIANSRYITEDVPQGLCLLESLGKHLSIKTPVAEALINLSSVALQTDFRAEGRNMENLGKKNIEKIIEDSLNESDFLLISREKEENLEEKVI